MSVYQHGINVAFFGATGGTVFNCLVHALKHEYIYCHVLVRDFKKIDRMLTQAMEIVPWDRLRIIEGDFSSSRDVRTTIFPPELGRAPVNVIIFGVGGFDMLDRFVYDSIICLDGIDTVYDVILSADNVGKPIPSRIVAIGSLGIGAQLRLPLSQIPLNQPLSAEATSALSCYNWFMSCEARDDKEVLEKCVLDEYNTQVLRMTNLVVQPGLLTDDKPLGLAAIRHGSPENPPSGYTISREDLGEWLYFHGILGAMEGRVVVCGP